MAVVVDLQCSELGAVAQIGREGSELSEAGDVEQVQAGAERHAVHRC